MTRALYRTGMRLLSVRMVRYLLASIGALACDMGVFLALLAANAAPVPAAALGYCCGIVVHWLFSSRAVFADGVAETGRARARQKSLFVASALAGLGLTTAIVAMGAHLGLAPELAKGFAIAASFVATYALRVGLVFRGTRP